MNAKTSTLFKNMLIIVASLSFLTKPCAEDLKARCLSPAEIRAVNNNYSDLMLCEKNYGDLKSMYADCLRCNEPFYKKSPVIVTAIISAFFIGFISAREK